MLAILKLKTSNSPRIQSLSQIARIDVKVVRLFILVTPVLGVLVFFMDLLFALSLQRFLSSVGLIDGVTDTRFLGKIKSVQNEAVILLMITLARLLSISLNSILMGLGFTRMERNVRNAIQKKAFKRFFDDVNRTSYLFNEVATGASNFFASTLSFLSRVVISTSLLFGLTWYSWKLTIFILLISTALVPLQRTINNKISQASRVVLNSIEISGRQLLSSVRNFLFLNIHRLQKKSESQISYGLNQVYSARKRFFIFTSIRTIVPQMTGVLALVFIAASSLSNQFDNQSEVIPFLYLLIRFFQSLSDMARTASYLRLDYPRVEVLSDYLLDTESENISQSSKDSMFLDCIPGFSSRNLEFSWGKAHTSIKYPDFEIQPGDTVHIQGKSGTGKTTLLFMLAGLIRPQAGEIVLLLKCKDSKKLNSILLEPSSHEFRTAYIGPEPFFINDTIRSNLNYSQKRILSDKEMLEMLFKVKLIPNKEDSDYLDKVISESGSGLSAGQKQRLSWARALMMNPTLLILDEATSNLDPQSKQLFNGLIAEGRGIRTTLIVDHSHEFSESSDVTLKMMA